jgi:hypothetical protein
MTKQLDLVKVVDGNYTATSSVYGLVRIFRVKGEWIALTRVGFEIHRDRTLNAVVAILASLEN